MSEKNEAWYASWFDTPYYHILYKERDHDEAQLFIDNLTQYLNLDEDSKVLDLACGRGRHAIYLNSLGYNVIGADLSVNSIETAKEFENEKLHFHIHDMREPWEEKFDAIFNLFTSFGYFCEPEDNVKTLKALHNSLSEYGLGVIDFMNVKKVMNQLVPEEVKTIEGIEFHIQRRHEDGFIYKDISFFADGKDHQYTEKVKALTLADFEKMMNENDIYLLDVFGDYKLKKFQENESDRLIMIFK